ncbi:hypothetical protein Pint_22369 [Pistacia integerrima]|uniref:Uncharacterized protein n=1 Tax=Pistacia integerrima TaxID=434235 RepID=A0ACC0YI88_9ROSI|nr:hypothetical protein Pint_22369 [Pistacia integerrima]
MEALGLLHCKTTILTLHNGYLIVVTSHYVTTDLNNLSLHAPYIGFDDITIGDGSSLPINHIGSISFTTSTTTFQLDNVLCVPGMKKNFISISQFCISNNVSVEFLLSSFLVRNLSTRVILLKSRRRMRCMNGWFPLQPPLYYSLSPVIKQLHLSDIIDYVIWIFMQCLSLQ